MQKRCFNCFFFSLVFSFSQLKGQPALFKTYTYEQGLGTYGIFKTFQDKFGFIWAATQGGIYRFNGRRFEQLGDDPHDNGVTSGHFFFDFTGSTDGRLYAVDFNKGIDMIDPATLARQAVATRLATYGKETLPNGFLKKIYADRLNSLWVGGKDWLAVKKNQQPQCILLQPVTGYSGSMNILFIKPLDDDHVAVSISGSGIFVYDIHTLLQVSGWKITNPAGQVQKEIKDILLDADTLYAISNEKIFKGIIKNKMVTYDTCWSLKDLPPCDISCFVKCGGEIWIGSNAGLADINLNSGKLLLYQRSDCRKRWLADNNINHLMIDRENNLWVSTSKSLQVLSLNQSRFRAFSGDDNASDHMDHIYGLVPKGDYEVFAAGTDGLYINNIESGMTKRVPGSVSLGVIHYIQHLSKDKWIVSTSKGMQLFDAVSGKLSQQALFDLFPEWRAHKTEFFNKAYKAGDVSYWASEEEEGLFKWDEKNHLITQFKAGTSRSGGLTENHLHNLKVDRDGFLWILSDNSILQFDLARDTVIRSIKKIGPGSPGTPNIFFDLYDDGKALWIGSFGGGLTIYDKSTERLTSITEKDGLCNNNVYGIIGESDSVLWVSSDKGLSRINKDSRICSNYFYEDGLQDNAFDEESSLQVGSKLYFGGINGFTQINTSVPLITPDSFPVYIYKVEYFEKGKKTVLTKLQWDNLALPEGTTTVSVFVTALTCNNNDNIHFSYRIGGIRNDFIEASDNNIISLNALNYGNYQVDIRYRNKKGLLVENALSFSFQIKPHWYQATWFRLLCIFMFGFLIYGLYRYRVSQIREKESIRRQFSNDLHDDIGGTLNSIKVFSHLAQQEHGTQKYIELIKQGVQSAIYSTRDLMWVLDDRHDTIEDLTARFENFALPLAVASNMVLSGNIDKPLLKKQLTKEQKKNIYLILKEAFNNSVKYAGCSQFACAFTQIAARKLSINISDDGCGFASAQYSDGNGLKNMKYRAEQMGFLFMISTTKGGGTAIQLTESA